MVREILKDETPSGVQAFFQSAARQVQDRRVRRALDLASTSSGQQEPVLGLYDRRTRCSRTRRSPPRAAERGGTGASRAAAGQGPRGGVHAPLQGERYRRAARSAASCAGPPGSCARRYRVKDGVLRDPSGEPLTIEFLLFEASFGRIVSPTSPISSASGSRRRSASSTRPISSTAPTTTISTWSYDAIIQPLTPGLEQRNFFARRAPTPRDRSTSAASGIPRSTS